MDLKAIRASLQEAGLDGWLFYDHHRRDPIAYRVLKINPVMCTRRWYYLIPKEGEPAKLLHRIEAQNLAGLPGSEERYSSWREQREGLSRMLGGKQRIAMQYSALNNIPYVGLVDAGTVELVKECGVEVVSSADLVQQFEACWSEEQWQSHQAAGQVVHEAVNAAFAMIRDAVRVGKTIGEYDVQQEIVRRFEAHGLITDEAPNVSVNAHTADPHYSPSPKNSLPIGAGDFVLLDVWAKQNKPGAVYFDLPGRVTLAKQYLTATWRSSKSCARRATRPFTWCRRRRAPGGPCAATKWMTRRARWSPGAGSARASCTARATRLAKRSMVTAPTWITSRPTTSGGSSPAPASRLNRAFICMISACGVKSTCSWKSATRA